MSMLTGSWNEPHDDGCCCQHRHCNREHVDDARALAEQIAMAKAVSEAIRRALDDPNRDPNEPIVINVGPAGSFY